MQCRVRRNELSRDLLLGKLLTPAVDLVIVAHKIAQVILRARFLLKK